MSDFTITNGETVQREDGAAANPLDALREAMSNAVTTAYMAGYDSRGGNADLTPYNDALTAMWDAFFDVRYPGI